MSGKNVLFRITDAKKDAEILNSISIELLSLNRKCKFMLHFSSINRGRNSYTNIYHDEKLIKCLCKNLKGENGYKYTKTVTYVKTKISAKFETVTSNVKKCYK